MEALKLNNVTIGAYQALERETQQEYEYHDGHVYALAGGAINHGLICGNLFGELRNGLKQAKHQCTARCCRLT